MIRLNPKYIPLLATAAVLIVVFGTGSLLYPNFGTPRVIVNLLGDNAFVGVAAVGESFVILSGGIDLSVGSMVAFVGILIARLLQAGCDPFLAMGIALCIGTARRSCHGLPDPLFRNASLSGHPRRPLLSARPRLCNSPRINWDRPSVLCRSTAAALDLSRSESSAAVYRHVFPWRRSSLELSSRVSPDSDGMFTRSDQAKAPLD